MKTKLIIEIKTPNKPLIFPEAGEDEETYKGRKKELADYRKEFANDLSNNISAYIRTYIEDGSLENDWLDDLDDLSVEGFESFDDYGIKIKIK